MNTIKINKKNKTLFIAHRGLSGIEKENTNPAFVAAGNRSYFGIETDVHTTCDGKYVIIHDDNTKRVSDVDCDVEKSSYDFLRRINLNGVNGLNGRIDYKIPSLSEYINICSCYDKTAVLELKNHFSKDKIFEICSLIENEDYFENVIFISFDIENLVFFREKYPIHQAQFLTNRFDDRVLSDLKKYNLDLDILYTKLNKEIVDLCHKNKINVNCWTVNSEEDAKKLIDYGVDFITTNILE